jgi:hypothetical protein
VVAGRSSSPLEARVHHANYQLRVVASTYALLGILALACAVALVVLGPYVGSSISAQATPLAICVGGGVTFCALTWLSLRYFVLSPAWATFTLAASILLMLCGFICAVKVTLTGWGGLIGSFVWWGLALVCLLGSYLLWRQWRASNHRWSGP